MKRCLTTAALLMASACWLAAQNVTIRAVNRPATAVFREIVAQTGKNFIYSSDLLEGMKVSVNANDEPLKRVLKRMFANTAIDFSINGDNVVLRRRKTKEKPVAQRVRPLNPVVIQADSVPSKSLEEVVVVSRLEQPEVETAQIGARKVTGGEVLSTPALFGESDVIKALQAQPGVAAGTEGLAGMYVHGGNADENLYMLDNVPLYQVNHFAGLFSAFNTDIIRYIDFYKTSFPAKYDGRLSSFMDVRLRSGNFDGHHGTARLGLTSGAFNISGPIGRKTTYMAAIRRSWYDVLSIPVLAVVNSHAPDEKVRFHYYFMDLNAKVNHRFSPEVSAFASAYFGNDRLRTGTKDTGDSGWLTDQTATFNWGNLVVQAGLNYRPSPVLSGELTAAYTRYFSSMKNDDKTDIILHDSRSTTRMINKTENNINDWIVRGDFTWRPDDSNRASFGAGYVRHSFLPARTNRSYTFDDVLVSTRDSVKSYGADELNLYFEDELAAGDKFRINAGIHASLFSIDGSVKHGISPRVSISYRPAEDFALKGGYSRTVQYVHQLTQSYLSLPTDQWIPITSGFKPETADKVAIGAHWRPADGEFELSAEAYYKRLNNIVDYCDEFYLRPPVEMWNARLTSGRGTAKGVDLKLEKRSGRVTGHIAYSLAWADRTFADKNGGRCFPARFDNRHTINIMINWNVSRKVKINALWTGHSGNRFTLLSQMWETPPFGSAFVYADGSTPLKASVNNYRLPFYHRLDLSVTVNNSRGYWSFGLYNAYNHMNTIAIRRGHKKEYPYNPVFQKVKLLPIIPSISYTWNF